VILKWIVGFLGGNWGYGRGGDYRSGGIYRGHGGALGCGLRRVMESILRVDF